MDEVELRRQLERAHADCFGWAMACCGRDRDDAEEVLQTVYLTVLDGRARYDGRSSFRTWLFGVIRRTAASERRKTWLHGLLLKREAGTIRPEAPAPPDAEVERDSRRHSLRHALAHLAARQREVLQLVFYHDLTVDEEKLSAEGEKMGRLLKGTQVDETQVLEEVDRILALEREIKRGQISLMVRIKNTLTSAQQSKLAEIRNRKD